VIIYDPQCSLCLRFKQGLEMLDSKLAFIPVDNEELYQSFPELKKQDCMAQVHMITKDLNVLKGVEVVDYLIKTLPGIARFSWLLESGQGENIKIYFYKKVEELRELSQKKDNNCKQCPRD
jgi:predicted DCC family thiol-disulfide oxidoreductase YuxK